MGLDAHGTKFLLYARKCGVSFAETAMLGRQTMLIDADLLRRNLAEFGFNPSKEETVKLLGDGFAEPFLELLGARQVVSFDASDFEKSSIVHDFNEPISDRFKDKFSVVLDGGTLEHVFNFPTAVKNCMEMVREGGHFLGLSPANNHMGHGFYQFSPELYYRVFSEQNGFRVEKILIYEESIESEWFEVADPDTVKNRVILINDQPSLMMIIAKKIKTVEIFKTFPQQSDYVTRWENRRADNHAELIGHSLRRKLDLNRILRIPTAVVRRAQVKLNHRFGMLKRQNKHFKKVNLP